MKVKLTVILFFAMIISSLSAKNDSTQHYLVINNWLTAGPVTIKRPVFSDEKNVKGEKFKTADLLKFKSKNIDKPLNGKTFLVVNDNKINWIEKDNLNFTTNNDSLNLKKAWQAVYIFADRFIDINIEVETKQCFELFVDGNKKLSNYSEKNNDEKPVTKKQSIKIERGKHLIVIKSLFNPEKKAKWNINTKISFSKKHPESSVKLELTPEQNMDIHHLLDGKHLNYVSSSYNGKFILFKYNKVFPPEGKSQNWFEIRDYKSNSTVYSSEYAKINSVKWAPENNSISFMAYDEGKEKLFLLNLETLKKKILIDDAGDISSYKWSPTGDFIIYTIDEKPKKDNDGVIHIINPMDRWPWWRSRGQLYKCNVSDGFTERLTYGYLNNNLQAISSDGRKLLFSQSLPYFKERPYTKQVLMELDIKLMTVDTIWVQNFGGSVQYSPDGTKLLVNGSAAMFNGAGINLPKKYIPNDYDIQSYIYDLKTKKVTPLTKNFNPSIQSAKWLKTENAIIFKVEEKSRNKLYYYDIDNKTFTDLQAKVDMVNNFDIPYNSEDYIVYSGQSMQYPKTAWLCSLKGENQRQIDDPEKEFFEDVVFGKVENWSFKNKKGRIIEGRVYYPPDFDQNKKYPVIVYYYGGTSATGRSFGGRYPKNLFAAQGYIVFVLQPSGATGFGQEFSALHVNNWGKTVADEIILGTKTFLKEHPYANANKVGCIGASYGGFMTMLLTTRTDIFAAAIEHAGISTISSYWGEGYWGYLYSSVASANSFPWNNKELYVNQSPLFHADKVNTPLLLLHGKADTNVPVGESIQMFTALKLLGKPVELIEIEGQDHHITDYKKRILWQKTILAWFDKLLKDQNEWWNYLYPEENL